MKGSNTTDVETVSPRGLDLQERNAQIAERNELLAIDDAERRAAVAQMTEVVKAADAAWSAVDTLSLPGALRTDLATLRQHYTAYLNEATAQMPVLAPIDVVRPPRSRALTV